MGNLEPDGQELSAGPQYRTLLAVSQAIVSHRELATLFHTLADQLHQVVRFDFLALVLHEAATDTMRLHVQETCEPVPPGTVIVLPTQEDPAGLVWQTQRPLITSCVAELRRWPRLLDIVQPYTPCWRTRITWRQERAELKKRPLNFDGIGLGLLALVVASWEVMFSKGQEWDWLGDSFWRVQTLLIVFVLALAGLLYRELTFASPVVNFRVLRERNFAVSCGITFGALAVLYAASVALPLLLLTSFGYNAYAAGLVLWPAGVFSMLTLLVVGRLLGWGIDARWLIASGLLVMAAGNYWMALMNLYISPWQAIWPRTEVHLVNIGGVKQW